MEIYLHYFLDTENILPYTPTQKLMISKNRRPREYEGNVLFESRLNL